jgi:hypothetical protein
MKTSSRFLAATMLVWAAACSPPPDKDDPPVPQNPEERPEGTSDFETSLGAGGGPSRGNEDTQAGGSTSSGSTSSGTGGAPSAPQRLVEESDIFKLEGNLLYVMNRYRGLQVLDITNLDQPVLVGRAPIFGYPREMYVRGTKAYIIVSDYYTFWRDETVDGLGGFYGSQLRIIDISDPTAPVVEGGINIEGDCGDSRIVGDVMYLVSQRYSWWWRYDSTDVEDKTVVLSVNIADPANIRAVDSVEFARAGWDNHISVTPETIYVAVPGYDYWEQDGQWGSEYFTTITAVDIHDPAGDITVRGNVRLPGHVQDRWAIDEYDDVLRVASGQSWGNGDVYLTTLDVTDKDRISQLARYTLRVNESLMSSRFDGPRGYLVSYRNIDPLFSFDLSDPASPRLMGELEMTGWLDFMVPMGDRIVAMGHEDVTDGQGNRTISLAVSLIDPTPNTPVLLSRVVLDGAWGWLPAERDDFAKVFRVLQDQGLVLFPFQAWSHQDYRYIGGVQLVDLGRNALTMRGLIQDAGWVERGIPHGTETVLTLSSEIFQVVNIVNRDQPAIRARLELARNVQDFAVLGDSHTVQLAGDWYMGDTSVVITPLSDPDAVSPLASVHVPAPYGRMFVNGSMAYVASLQSTDPDPVTGEVRQATRVQVIDLTNPAQPVVRGSVTLPEQVWLGYHSWYWGSGDEVVQVGGSVLAFHPYRYGWYGRGDCYDCGGGGGPAEIPAQVIYLVDLSNPDQPVLASTVTIDGVDWAWGLKARGDMLYLSYYVSAQRNGNWYARYFLRRIDVSNPANPQLLPAVNIPGFFVDASEDNRYVYTLENWWDGVNQTSRTMVHALALLDNRAYLRSSVELQGWVSNVVIQGGVGFTTTYWYENTTVDNLERWVGHMQLITLDLSNAASIRVAGTADVPYNWAYLQKVDRGLAFLGSGAGIFVYSVSDVNAPTFRQFFRTQGWANDLILHGDRAYLPSGYHGVQVLDVLTMQPL